LRKALSEIEKLPQEARIYKSVGNFLVPQTRDAALQELKDRKELLELHVKTLTKQESMLREQIEKLREEINKELAKLRGRLPRSRQGRRIVERGGEG
jgi:prefoldin beta subunit